MRQVVTALKADPSSPTSLSRALGVSYAVGGAVALLWTQMPHTPSGGDAVIALDSLIAVILGAALVVLAERLSRGLLHVALGVIQLVIGSAYLAQGAPDGDIRLYFLWAAPYAALYLRPWAAAAHVVWTIAVASAVILVMPGRLFAEAVTSFFMLIGTLVATSALVATAAAVLRRAEAVQRHDALHDALTGLPNRRQLIDALDMETDLAGLTALVLLDLDAFKAVNDRHGHAIGDALLQEVGRRLMATCRPGDLVCRLGGDEFALVAHGLRDAVEAEQVASHTVQALARVEAEAPGLAVQASSGIRVFDRAGLPASEALRDADAALYVSKREGRGVPHLWHPGLRSAQLDDLALAEDLSHALATGELYLVYQPVVDIHTSQVRGVEALARWEHPTRGTVPPDVFIPCAERRGVISDLTRWVLAQACEVAAAWPVDACGEHVTMALNISSVSLADLEIVKEVQCALQVAGLSPDRLVLEVTETAAVLDLDRARSALEGLEALGVALALDDFGTGHSSLTHVQALPFDILKIDRSFVAAAQAGDRRSEATIAAICALADQLDVDVVAEGVEDLTQLTALQAMGCRYAQGYALSRPIGKVAVDAAITSAGPQGWFLKHHALHTAAPPRTPSAANGPALRAL